MLYEYAHIFFGLVMSFVVTGVSSWSFQTLSWEVFKTEQEKLFVLSIICVLIV